MQPTLIKSATFIKELAGGKSLGRYIDSDTAAELKDMMKNNVVENYGEWNFEGMDMYAKSGTAESGSWNPDAWFVGFTDDEDAPYAFVVWVKEGGFGAEGQTCRKARRRSKRYLGEHIPLLLCKNTETLRRPYRLHKPLHNL